MYPFANDVIEVHGHLNRFFRKARPFPHITLDGWFDESALSELDSLFDDRTGWKSSEDGKTYNSDVASIPFFQEMYSEPVLDFLRLLTGIPNLVGDPTFRGAGLHATGRGGRLGIHVDFNRHHELPLKRAVNTILYLNEDWKPEWNGTLTLTSDTNDMNFERYITPNRNRWVIFEYSDQAWHGHPEPLMCPEGVLRKSAAIYYYVPIEQDLTFHSTIYA